MIPISSNNLQYSLTIIYDAAIESPGKNGAELNRKTPCPPPAVVIVFFSTLTLTLTP